MANQARSPVGAGENTTGLTAFKPGRRRLVDRHARAPDMVEQRRPDGRRRPRSVLHPTPTVHFARVRRLAGRWCTPTLIRGERRSEGVSAVAAADQLRPPLPSQILRTIIGGIGGPRPYRRCESPASRLASPITQ
jgi:hypothetical protein